MEKTEQNLIDSLYLEICNLIGEMDLIQSRILEIRDEMKEVVSSEVFK